MLLSSITSLKELAGRLKFEPIHSWAIWIINKLLRLRLTSSQNYSQILNVAKEKFHTTLLNILLSGLPVPASVYPQFEKVFKGIFSSIQETQDQTILQNQWILLFTYRWDETQERIFTCKFWHWRRNKKISPEGIAHVVNLAHRTIYYEVNQSIKKYTSQKKQVSDVHLDFFYKQDDFALTETIWNKVKNDVTKAIGQNDVINDVIDIPV